MVLTDVQIEHFHANGFVLIPNPFGVEAMRAVERRQVAVEPAWESRTFGKGMNRGACQFLMAGDVTMPLAEREDAVGVAAQLLGTDSVHIGACGLGDASKTVSADGRPVREVQWHADGSPDEKQVSFRTALDRHDASNAPLRILPGSHRRPKAEVAEELRQIEIATGRHDGEPPYSIARHPGEVDVVLDPRWTLVWTPSCWHATGVKTAAGPRRAMAWNYYPEGGRRRDVAAVKEIWPEWEAWDARRKRLWVG